MYEKNEKNEDESKKGFFSRLFGGGVCYNIQIALAFKKMNGL